MDAEQRLKSLFYFDRVFDCRVVDGRRWSSTRPVRFSSPRQTYNGFGLVHLVQLFPHEHVIDLIPSSNATVYPCGFGTRGASEICVYKSQMEGRVQAGADHFCSGSPLHAHQACQTRKHSLNQHRP